MNIEKLAMTGALALLLSGCTNLGTSPIEEDFGNSVRNMVSAQQAHPEVSANPNPEVVDGTDAHRVVKVLETYREDVAVPQEVDAGVVINVGK